MPSKRASVRVRVRTPDPAAVALLDMIVDVAWDRIELKGYSYSEVASLSNLSEPTVRSLLNNETQFPEWQTPVKLCEGLGQSLRIIKPGYAVVRTKGVRQAIILKVHDAERTRKGRQSNRRPETTGRRGERQTAAT